jgi:hypothetical protein
MIENILLLAALDILIMVFLLRGLMWYLDRSMSEIGDIDISFTAEEWDQEFSDMAQGRQHSQSKQIEKMCFSSE